MKLLMANIKRMKARDGAYVREKFFGKYPETKELVS